MTPADVSAIVNRYLSQPHAALLNGMLLGMPIKGYVKLNAHLQIVGLLHLVVLSGMNITIMTNIVSRLTGIFGRKISGLLSVLIIVFFVAFVSPQAPVVRAGFCSIFTIVGLMFGRKAHPLYLVVLSAICIGIFWPTWLTSISFQLSYGATIGILLFDKKQVENSQTLFNKITHEVAAEFRTSFAAQVFTAPLILIHFKQISLIAPIANVLVCFLVGPIMIVGFIMVVLGAIHPILGQVPAVIVYGMLEYMLVVIDGLAKVPFVFIQI